MSVKRIVVYNNPLLRKKCKPVKRMNPEIKQLIADMAETMYSSNGAGLAAIQIGDLHRVVVVDVSEKKDELQVFINPKITFKKGKIKGIEACLSVPNFEGEVIRDKCITLKAKDIHFNDIEIQAEDYLARALQHEIDHLDGVLYIDRAEKGSLRPVDEVHDDF